MTAAIADDTALADERALCFPCEDSELAAIVHGDAAAASGLLMVAGGGQYRVGSHRLYVQLARSLAAAGHAALRFDHRGVGDSDGEFAGFEHLEADIAAALVAFRRACPGLRRVTVFGVCDDASAALLAVLRLTDVDGLVLVNPWVYRPVLEARARLSSYYLARLGNRDFWARLLRGRLDVAASGRALGGYLRAWWRDGAGEDEGGDFVTRMLAGLLRFRGRVLVVLSGQDLVAQQFRQLAGQDRAWKEALERAPIEIASLAAADHTFSSREHREAFERLVIEWLAMAPAGR